MAHKTGDSHQGRRTQEEEQKRSTFSKVKNKLDLTKHLGFQSGPDTLSNRQALENARAREAKEEQNSARTPGNGPRDGETVDWDATPQTENMSTSAPEAGPEKTHSKPIQFDQSPPHPASQDDSNESAEEQSQEKPKKSHAGWGRYLAHKVHQVSRAAASKELSDDLIKKKTKNATK